MTEITPASSGLDHFFLNVSSVCREPICYAFGKIRYDLFAPLQPGQFNNAPTVIQEIARRVLIGFGTLLTPVWIVPVLGVSVLGTIFRAIGFALQKENFTHIVTGTPEKAIAEGEYPTVGVQNILGVAGEMNFDHGGTRNWRVRLPQIVEQIRSAKLDVLVLQELYDEACVQALIQALKGEYAHIFCHLGKTTMGVSGGLMVFSKCAVHHFSNTDFHNSSWQLKRGLALIEVKRDPNDPAPCLRMVGTHLIDGTEAKDKQRRMEQVAQVIDVVAQRTLTMPTIWGGDFNIERGSREAEVLDPYLRHGYNGLEITCTNKMTAEWNPSKPSAPEETIDYLSIMKRVGLADGRVLPVDDAVDIEVQLIRAFGDNDEPRSDHHGLSGRVTKHRPLA